MKLTLRRLGRCWSGGTTVTPVSCSRALGAGSAIGGFAAAVLASETLSAAQPDRARDRIGQPPISCSIGASARPSRIEPAIIEPGVISPLSTMQAPRPSIADCRKKRRVFDIVENWLTTSAEARLACSARLRFACQRDEHGAAHAEALDDLGLLADGLGEAFRGHRRRRRLDGRALGHHLVGEGDRDEDEAAADREPAEQRVEAEDREDEERRPRQVEEREEHRRGHELLHRLEVAQPRPRLAALARDEGAGEAGLEDLGVEAGLDQRADAGGDAAAGVVEHAHDAVERRDQHGEGDQRRLRPARQHPVVDLEHVERPGQHQDVDEAAEDRQRHEQRPRSAQGLVGGRGGGLGHGLQALTPLARAQS